MRLVDKVLPQLAWLAPEFSEACSADKFMQADAARERKLPFCLQTVFPRTVDAGAGLLGAQRGRPLIAEERFVTD